jgi:hypothetical protein
MSETTSGNENNAAVDESQAKQTNDGEQNGEEVSAQPSVKEMRAIVLTGFGGQSSLLPLYQFYYLF